MDAESENATSTSGAVANDTVLSNEQNQQANRQSIVSADTNNNRKPEIQLNRKSNLFQQIRVNSTYLIK